MYILQYNMAKVKKSSQLDAIYKYTRCKTLYELFEETKKKISQTTKGKSFEERYGCEEARIRKEKLKKSWEFHKLNNTSRESVQQEHLYPVLIDLLK